MRVKKDSNPRTQVKAIGSRIDIMNVFSCSQNVNRRIIFSHYCIVIYCNDNTSVIYCNDKLFCRFLWLHYATKYCLNEVAFVLLVELTAWVNNICFGNDALTSACDSWNNKLFGILNQMYTIIVYMYMYLRRLFCMPYANFMGQNDCCFCIWCIKKLSTCHRQYALWHSATRNVSDTCAVFSANSWKLVLVLEKSVKVWGFHIRVCCTMFPCLVYPDTTHDPW